MIQVDVNASKKYSINIERNLLDKSSELIKSLKGVCRAAVISDTNVFSIYGGKLCENLKAQGFEVCSHVFPAGEKSKTLETYSQIIEFLAESHLSRTDLVIALGGGVVGDVSGFCAATFLRGIDYIQIPTSLLAAVDSSVGGKTAVDLPTGKNLVGAFHQPSIVLCDTACFDTLEKSQLSSGFGEVIKYGVMSDAELFEKLEKKDIQIENIVERCVSIKRDVVIKDEFDNGDRMFLNLGHTLGHAVEKHSNFTLTHGAAVGIGMVMIAKISEKYGYAQEEIIPKLKAVLDAYGLPTAYDISAEELFKIASGDKKTKGTSITLVMPERIGKCRLVKLTLSEFQIMLNETF